MKKYQNITNDNNLDVIVEVNLTQKKKYFQEINKEVVLHKKKMRIIKNANLKCRKYTIYYYGQYKYFDESKEKYCFITEKLPNVTGKHRHDNDTILLSVKPVLKSEMTISYASNYAKENFNLTCVPSTIWHWVGAIDIDNESKFEIEEQTKQNFSGHLSIDEVYDNKDGIIFTTDPVKDLIISSKICDGKPNNEIIENELNQLKNKGFNAITCTKDGSPLYMNTITKVFINILLQICIFHLIKNMIKYFLDWHRKIRDEVKTNFLPRGLKSYGKKIKQYLFRKRCLFVKRDLSEDELNIIKNICFAIPEFKLLRNKYLKFLSIFDSDNIKEASKKYWLFVSDPIINEKMPDLIKQIIKHYKNNELFTYLLFDKNIRKKIRTTNHTERTNRKFRKKQKTHYRIRNKFRRQRMIMFMYYFYNYKSLGIKNKLNLIILKSNYYCYIIIFSDYEFLSNFMEFYWFFKSKSIIGLSQENMQLFDTAIISIFYEF